MPVGQHGRRHRSAATAQGRRSFTVLAMVLALAGGTVVGVALAAQQRPVEVALVAPAPTAPAPRPTAAVAGDEASPGPAPTTTPTPPPPLILSPSKPVGLDIPAIDVHSVVAHLGQSENGALEAPAPGPHYDEAAWYRYSPPPGSLGPAIMLGHVDSAANGPSVFFRLGDLRKGDRVMVTRADRSIAVFSVDRVERYAKDDFPTAVVYHDIDHAGLRIVTCGGAFDEAAGHYLDNIVVFARLVGSRTG